MIEMTLFTFGGSTNDYVEVPDPDYLGADGTTRMKRPPAGSPVIVQDPDTQAAPVLLTDIMGGVVGSVITLPHGYLAFKADVPVPIVRVSADNGGTWKFLVAVEALAGGAAATAEVTEAVQAAVAARVAAEAADARQKANTVYRVVATGANLEGPYPTPLPTGYYGYLFIGRTNPGALSRPIVDEWEEPST